jgi:acyl-CoA synthetase (AMP-forming)/AMP-acid ligase II
MVPISAGIAVGRGTDPDGGTPYLAHVSSELEPRPSTRIDLPTRIREIVCLDPSAPALQFEGVWRPWSHLSSGIDALDEVLRPHGWLDGTMVGVVMRNRPEIVRAVSGILGTGRCLVTLSSAVSAARLADEVVRLALPVVVATASDWRDELREASRLAGSLGLVVDDDEGSMSVVVAASARPGHAATRRDGVAVQMLTSGTTGDPKRVDLRYSSLEYEIVSTSRSTTNDMLAAPRLASGVAIVWNPLLHIAGLRGLITNLVAGRRIALLERFSVPAWAALVAEHRPRAISLVPSAIRMVLDADLPPSALDGVQVVISGTAPLPPETALEWEERYGIPVLVVYGATEFAGGVAGWTLRDWQRFGAAKRGSVGRVNPGVEARVVDETSGEPLPFDTAGLLEVRGRQLAHDGWVRTNDLARIDVDGFIWIDGRADNVIIRGGFKVATDHVADVLRRHAAVLDAGVIGLPDERLGQVPAAAVELRPGAAVTEEELEQWAHQHLTHYQVPVEIRVVEELPRTLSMKVSQPEVRQLFLPP